ncbi:MAG: DUF362 domain-containing protein [PVC group bacterium]|nr:DUF362 domain-containing protein [PVC group bacterium]
MKKFTRRELLKTSLGLAASVVSTQVFPPYLHGQPEIIQPQLSKVAITKGSDIRKITEEALNLIGGVKQVVKPGHKVFIKPNYISGGLMGHDPVTAGEIPHPEVVATVARECVKAGAKQVIIGEWIERPLAVEWGGKSGKSGAQVKTLVDFINKKFGQKVSLVNLREYTSSFLYVPSQTKLQWLAIPKLVAEADLVVSVPVFKTHHRPIPVTLGMKNFVGIMPSVLYGEPRMKLHEAGIHQIVVDIAKGIKPRLTIVSGAYGMEGEGVSLFLEGTSVDVSQRLGGGLVVAGFDPVATDATATRVITKNWQPRPKDEDLGVPWYIKHLRMGFQQGLGEIRQSRIKVEGYSLEEIAMSWQMPENNTYPELPGHV